MIDLTVKTLDSQNHAFSLSDDITVREFKEHIAETVSVPADSQRLIYCGRVLQDEKRLNEYDVNGKVIHLVQRAPPQSTQRGNSGGQSHGQNGGRGDQQQPPRSRARQPRTQFHGNPMYLGSFAIPAEVVDGHEWPISQLSNTLSNSRLVVARRMLDQANRVLDRLANPTAAAANDSAAPESEEPASGAETTASATPQQDDAANRSERLLQQLSGGGGGQMGGLLEVATAIAGLARPTYFWSSRTGANDGTGTEPSAPAAETSDESQMPSQEQQPSRQGSANSSADSAGNARTSTPPTAPQAPRPPQMAQLLGRLMETQDRLRPFLTRYRELMELDPEIPGGRGASGEDIGTVEENQRIADGVTECFHFLSHANHALSDIIVDMGQQPPRNLRCRPMVIHHSAILQSGIPIQVEARISVARNDGSNGESGEENSDSATRPPTSATAAPPTSQHPIDLTFMTEHHHDSAPSAEGQQADQQQAQNQPPVDSPFGAIFNITNNMEVLMEMGPPEISGPPGSNGAGGPGAEQNQTNSGSNNNNNNNNNNAPGTSGVAGIFPWGPTPPPEMIRNLMHVVAGYMAQSAAAVTTVSTTTSTATPTMCLRQRVAVGGGGGAAPNPGQSTQARSNVGTHPTTSTQTRSTPRPHVFHPHPLGVGVGMGQNLDFDPFLPCNSHHIRRTPSATPTNSAATSSPQQPAQQQFNPQSTQTSTAASATLAQPDDSPAETEGDTDSDRPVSPNSMEPQRQRESHISLQQAIANLRGSTGSRMNAGESEGIYSLEDLLVVRGINNVLWSAENTGGDPSPRIFQRLFTLCARIEVSEWYAFLETGEFNRDDVWPRIRPHIAALCLPFISPNLAKDVLHELRPYLSRVFKYYKREANIREGRRIDLLATVGAVVFRHVQMVIRYVDRASTPFDDEWGRGLVKIVREFGRELFSVLRFSLRNEQEGMEAIINALAQRVNIPSGEVREWFRHSVVQWLCEYSRSVEQLPQSKIIPLLVYSEGEAVADTVESAEAARPRETQSQSEPEPMETEEASSNRTINDPLDLDDGEEVPTTFPGHEALLPEWVPIIARDGIRQRRQLQLQGGEAFSGAFSEAYLDGLPSKRRKLVEQQKARILVSPTPNHSSIPASIERLVRESVVRAGVEEADGAAAAVAADPGVRRVFGQAVRDCLNPLRLQTPDFPDARRFPNATRYFAEKDKPPTQ